MNTLIVHYLPRGERSHTKKLLDRFIEHVDGTDLQILDLAHDVPDLFLPDRLMAYIRRDYLGEQLSAEEEVLMAQMDRMTDQLVAADALVLATPMHNFSLPAIVKGWFDAVMLKGRTWDADESGPSGLLAGKRALVLMASGGTWEGELAYMEHGLSLARVEFAFMGVSRVETVWASGMTRPETNVQEVMDERCRQVARIAAGWGVAPGT